MKTLVDIYSSEVTREKVLKPPYYAQHVAFFSRVLDNMSSDSCFSRRIDISDECFFHVLYLQKSKKPRIQSLETSIEIEQHELHIKIEKESSGLARQRCSSYILLQKWNSRRSRFFKCQAHTSGHKLNNFHRMVSSRRMELLLKLHVLSVLYWMKCFQNRRLENMLEQGA